MRVLNLMENESGVQDSGSLSFYFDPSYQELILHQVQIHRGDQVLNRLDRSKIKNIQSEPALDGHMLTGGQSAVLFVEDLRVGDVLEYSYTTRGYNPILEGHYSPRFSVQFGTAVDRQRIRVLWPSEKPLHLRTHLTDASPAKSIGGGLTEYTWDFTNLTAIDFEDALPSSYEPYPYVELSDFKDWARVVDWALPLYAPTNLNLPPELQQLIAQWQSTGASDEERARLALEFVQDELRYTALELGPDSYRPAPPSETFRKRFGDCKGKTLLLCAIFRALNFEAWPALVHSYRREAVAHRLPSPFAFNHVIVKLQLGGSTFWLDPTASYQGGALADRHHSRFGKALVIQPGVTALADVPLSRADNMRQQVSSTFEIHDYNSPVAFTVQTVHRGFGADDLREDLARNDIKDLQKKYLNFYARFYPDVESTQPLKISDDRRNNLLTVTEYYRIRDIWKLNATTKKREFTFYGDSLVNVLTDPSTRLRKMPLRIPYPLKREHEIAIHLPDSDWTIANTEKTIDSDAFIFHYRRNFSGKIVRYHFDCETKVSELPAPKVAAYLDRLDKMELEVGEQLERPDYGGKGAVHSLNWLVVVVAIFGLIFTFAAGIWLWRMSMAPSGEPPPLIIDPQLQGLGGWLFLVGVGICLGPISRTLLLLKNWEGYFSIHIWQTFALPQSEQYHPAYAPFLIFELLGNIALLGLNVLVVAFYFAKRKWFPKSYVLLLWSNALFLLTDELVGAQFPFLPNDSKAVALQQVFRLMFLATIWTLYMVRSRRVKATFVR